MVLWYIGNDYNSIFCLSNELQIDSITESLFLSPPGKSVHYEETPLMFSRATSVSSLSSFEVQSIHDDRSSVVSDFRYCLVAFVLVLR